MKTVSEFPREIIEQENVWIPVTDGLKLAARIWRPKDSASNPVPAILEYIPYRKRFGSTERDEITHKYLAGHGYACIRLDIRGSGESEGVLTDEYLEEELADGVSALNWIADQDWCTGSVGMMGISWGGFNALQIAALKPEPLKAIVTVSSSDDRYADDIHHMGGALLGDNLSWSSVMFSFNTMPPDPALVGDKWRDMWRERLEGSGLWLSTWLQHQRRDQYWRHGSICQDYSDVEIPVYAVSGWADGYTNTVFRLVENLPGPTKGLVGPWGHTYPHIGRPGPAIDFLSELLRWWDRWLKGDENGIEDEPPLSIYLQDSAPPNPEYDHRPGRWVTTEAWPSRDVEQRVFKLGEGGALCPEDVDVEEKGLDVASPVTLGLFAGKWCSYANGPDLAGDQRFEDGGALIFQTEPLEEDLDILGAPVVELELSSDKPIAMVAVRLSDRRPDHQITRITYGMLNLTHRKSREHPAPLEPGQTYRVEVPLNHIGQTIPKGHRIRVSVSTVYWPLAWTPPEPTKLTIQTGASRLVLPVRTEAAQQSDANGKSFGPPVAAPGPATTVIEPAENTWKVQRDLASKYSELEVVDSRGVFRLDDIDLTVGAHARETYSAVTGDFTSVRGKVEWVRTLERDDWTIMTRTTTTLTSDEKNFYITAELDAYEGDVRFACKSWNETIPRDLV